MKELNLRKLPLLIFVCISLFRIYGKFPVEASDVPTNDEEDNDSSGALVTIETEDEQSGT